MPKKTAHLRERNFIAVEIPITRLNHHICGVTGRIVHGSITCGVVQISARSVLRLLFLFGRALDLVIFEG